LRSFPETRRKRRRILPAPADIVSQVLNFGLSASIDVQISGMDLDSNYALGERAGNGSTTGELTSL
jgi:hypothetical protein